MHHAENLVRNSIPGTAKMPNTYTKLCEQLATAQLSRTRFLSKTIRAAGGTSRIAYRSGKGVTTRGDRRTIGSRGICWPIQLCT